MTARAARERSYRTHPQVSHVTKGGGNVLGVGDGGGGQLVRGGERSRPIAEGNIALGDGEEREDAFTLLGSSHACVCTRASSPRALAKSKSIVSRVDVVGGCCRDAFEVSPLRVALFRKKAVSTPPPKPMIVSGSPRSMLGFVWSSIRRLAVASKPFALAGALGTPRRATGVAARARLDRAGTMRHRRVFFAFASSLLAFAIAADASTSSHGVDALAARLSGIAPTPSVPQAWPSTPPARARADHHRRRRLLGDDETSPHLRTTPTPPPRCTVP